MGSILRARRIVWRFREEYREFPWRLRRTFVAKAIRRIVRSLKPWGVISGGTDCDGMRYAGAGLYWTRGAADASAEQSYDHAEGPHGARVVKGAEAREFERSYEPDTRDRFAERMGY